VVDCNVKLKGAPHFSNRQEIGKNPMLPDVVGVPDEGDRSQTNCDEKRPEGERDSEEDALETVHMWFGGGHWEASCFFTIADAVEVRSERNHWGSRTSNRDVKNPHACGI